MVGDGEEVVDSFVWVFVLGTRARRAPVEDGRAQARRPLSGELRAFSLLSEPRRSPKAGGAAAWRIDGQRPTRRQGQRLISTHRCGILTERRFGWLLGCFGAATRRASRIFYITTKAQRHLFYTLSAPQILFRASRPRRLLGVAVERRFPHCLDGAAHPIAARGAA